MLERFAVPALHAPLPRFAAEPVREGPVDADRPFMLSGRRSVVHGCERRGLLRGWLAPGLAIGAVGAAGFEARRIVVGGVGIKRELMDDEGIMHERIFVPRDLPAVLIEWRSEAEGPRSLHLAWNLGRWPATSGDPVAWQREDRALLARDPEGMLSMSVLSEAAAEWEIESAENAGRTLQVRVHIELPSRGSARLLLTAARDDKELGRVLHPFRSADGQVHSRAAALRMLGRDRLRLECPDPAAADAVECSKQRLHTLVRLVDSGLPATGYDRIPTADPATAAWVGIGQLAAGDFEGAAGTLRALGQLESTFDSGPHSAPGSAADPGMLAGTRHAERATLLYLLLAARTLAWTGDLRLLGSEWPKIRKAWRSVADISPPGPLLPATAMELAIAAEQVGDAALTSELQAAGNRHGRADGDTQIGGEALASALAAEVAGPESGWNAWAAYASDNPERGYEEWKRLSTSGTGTVPRGKRFREPGAAGGPSHALSSALVICPLVHGLLGVRPDALRGRLEIHLHPPSAWERFAVESLRMGDARVGLRYTRSNEGPSSTSPRVNHELELEQKAGRTPVRIILEIAVPGTLERGAVDGTAADFDIRRSGARTVVPLQVVLDHTRKVEVVCGLSDG